MSTIQIKASGITLPSIRSLFPEIDFDSYAELPFAPWSPPRLRRQSTVELPVIQSDEDESESDDEELIIPSDEEESGSDGEEEYAGFGDGEDENEWDIDPVPAYTPVPRYTEFAEPEVSAQDLTCRIRRESDSYA